MMRSNFLVALALSGLLIATQVGNAQTTGSTGSTSTSPTATTGTTGTTSTSGGLSSGSSGSGSGGAGTTVSPASASLTASQTTTSAQGAAGSATTIPSSSNPLSISYVNPTSLGLPSLYTTKYGPQNTISTSGGPKGKYTFLYVATPSATTTTATTTTTPGGFTTYGTVRSPSYSTVLSEDMPVPVHVNSEVQSRVRSIIDRSSFLKNKNNIQVTMDGNTVVLSGQATEREVQLVESMVRMTPGVFEVRNQLQAITARK